MCPKITLLLLKGVELPELAGMPPAGADDSADDSKLEEGGEDEADAEFEALLSGKTKTPSTAKKTKKRSSSTDSESSVTKKAKSAKKPKNNGTADEDMVNSHSGKKKSVKDAVSNFLNRPMLDRPASPSLDISTSSQILRDKDIQASSLKFGFLGKKAFIFGHIDNHAMIVH